jgi:hypothetical protein
MASEAALIACPAGELAVTANLAVSRLQHLHTQTGHKACAIGGRK